MKFDIYVKNIRNIQFKDQFIKKTYLTIRYKKNLKG